MIKKMEIKSTADVEVGSYMVEFFANSIAFYRVLKTTAKTISIQRVQSKEVGFEPLGGCTGYSTVIPTDKPYYGEGTKIERKVAQPYSKGVYFSGSIGRGTLSVYQPDATYSEYYD